MVGGTVVYDGGGGGGCSGGALQLLERWRGSMKSWYACGLD